MFSFLAHSSEKVCRFDGYSSEKAYLCHNIRYKKCVKQVIIRQKKCKLWKGKSIKN